MGRNNQGRNPTTLGRSLVKAKGDKRRQHQQRIASGGHDKHTTDLEENRGLQSTLDQSALDEFLNDAIMKEKEFVAEKQQLVIVGMTDVVSAHDVKEREANHVYTSMRIPRRPKWHKGMSADELDRQEKDEFLNWRRDIAMAEEKAASSSNGKEITPFEKNLEVWRQLWRVVERSDVVVQIVDSRNPLLYYCDDIEAYVKEIDPRKKCLLILNKADFLTQASREMWAEYLTSQGIDFVFWSAGLAQAKIELQDKQAKLAADAAALEEAKRRKEEEFERYLQPKKKQPAASKADKDKADKAEKEKEKEKESEGDKKSVSFDEEALADKSEKKEKKSGKNKHDDDETPSLASLTSKISSLSTSASSASSSSSSASAPGSASASSSIIKDKTKILSRSELLQWMLASAPEYTADPEHKAAHPRVNIGMIGFPNVGKSSTINVLVSAKKTSVSATPGKTKHFQTLNISDNITLCDCPGLVFPTFAASRSSLVLNGVVPIDQLTDYISPVELLCQYVSRDQFGDVYALSFPEWKPVEGMDLLRAHAHMRGFNSAHGRLDVARSSRVVLKDFVNGRILYCHPPPSLSPAQRARFYRSFPFAMDVHTSLDTDSKETKSKKSESKSSHEAQASDAEEEEEGDEGEEDEGDEQHDGPDITVNRNRKLLKPIGENPDLDENETALLEKMYTGGHNTVPGSGKMSTKEYRKMMARNKRAQKAGHKTRNMDIEQSQVELRSAGRLGGIGVMRAPQYYKSNVPDKL